MKYHPINSDLFKQNRNRLMQQLVPNALALLNANDEMPRSADGLHTFRQNSDLFYLTGIDQEETILVLFPNCIKTGFEEVLFIRRTNENLETWEGHKYTKEEARASSGIEKIFWTEEFEKVLSSLMYLAESCYLNLNEHGRMANSVPDKDLRFARSLQLQYPLHQYRRLAPILHDLRAVKSNFEIDLMKEAIGITKKAYERILKFVRPGVYEYEIEAEIQHEFLRNRATGPAYSSIVASGKNSCILHYIDNNRVCKAGDVLLMDFGAEYANYAADLTRTIPVSGRYTDRQKAVYNAVLRVMKEAINMLRPGTLLDDYQQEVGKVMEKELIQLGLLDAKKVEKQNPKKPLYKKYFMHGTSHFLGLDVHDVGSRYKPIQPGMVFTCEPGIYIKEEDLGIRIENDILVTANGPVDLMAGFPIEVDEIEDAMNG